MRVYDGEANLLYIILIKKFSRYYVVFFLFCFFFGVKCEFFYLYLLELFFV